MVDPSHEDWHRTPWEELSEGDLSRLLDDAEASPEVRAALRERLRWEHRFRATLEEPSVALAELTGEGKSAWRRGIVAGIVVLVAILVGAGYWLWADRDVQVAESRETKGRVEKIAPDVVKDSQPSTRYDGIVAVKAPIPPEELLTGGEGSSDVLTPHSELELPAAWQLRLVREIIGFIETAEAVAASKMKLFILYGMAASNDWAAPIVELAEQVESRSDELIDDLVPDLPRRLEDHPLATEPSREGLALALEMEDALDVGATEDAMSLLLAIGEVEGLTPAPDDASLWLPAGELVRQITRRAPQLSRRLAAERGEAAQQEVRQAIASGDAAVMAILADRYAGTQADALASVWLGNVALAEGKMLRAARLFDRARTVTGENDAAQALRVAAEMHWQLAQALQGEGETADLPDQPVTIGSQTLQPEEWRTLLGTLRERNRVESRDAPIVPLPQLVDSRAETLVTISGDVGRDAGKNPPPHVDWAGRQLAVTERGSQLYISNQFQVVAYDSDQRVVQWSVGLGPEQGDALGWPGVGFRPLLSASQLFVRRLLGRGPELVCLMPNDEGKIAWRTSGDWVIVSEPWLWDERLFTIAAPVIRGNVQPVTLYLTEWRRDDGQPLSTVPLFVLQLARGEIPRVHVETTADGVFVQAKGVIGRFDRAGHTQWLRRLPFLPSAIDRFPQQVEFTPPVRSGGRLVVTIPDARQVVVLNSETGREQWRNLLPDVLQVVHIDDQRLITRERWGLVAYSTDDGSRIWSRQVDGLFNTVLADETHLLTASHADECDGELRLQLRGLESGTLDAEASLEDVPTGRVEAGPWVLHRGQLLLFLGTADQPGVRRLELLQPINP